MRVNVYAEEMTDRVEIVEKTIDGQTFTGVRFYLYLPVSAAAVHANVHDRNGFGMSELRGPFMHREGDDDSAAVTFWGKQQLRKALQQAIELLDAQEKRRGGFAQV